MNIDIRRAGTGDAETVSALNGDVQAVHVEAVPWLFKDAAMSVEATERLLAKPDNHILIASAEAVPIGYLFAEHRKIPETPLTHPYETFHVHHISVRATHRQTGIGAALMDALRTTGDELGVKRITADVWSFNDTARRFFAGQGLAPYMERLWI